MKIEELIMHKSGNIMEYQEAIEKRNRLRKKIGNLSNKIQDEEDSISVFVGELTEKEQDAKERHEREKGRLENLRNKKMQEIEKINKKIEEMQR